MVKQTAEKNNRKSVLKRKVIKSISGVDNNETKSEPKPKTVKHVKIDDEVFSAICDELSDGVTVEEACNKHGVLYRTFRKYIEKSDENIGQLYARAREWRGEACLMKIDSIMRKLEAGEIDSATANVLINTEKWKASKFYPKMYGDRQQTQFVDEKGNGINPFDAFYKAVCEKKDYTR